MNDQEFDFFYKHPNGEAVNVETKRTNILSIPLEKVAKFPGEKTLESLSYNASLEDWSLSHGIMVRILEIGTANGFNIDRMQLHQDLMTAHCNATPLHLWQLLASDNDDFCHDVLGIGLHIDRVTGRMLNGFTPRFAVKKS